MDENMQAEVEPDVEDFFDVEMFIDKRYVATK